MSWEPNLPPVPYSPECVEGVFYEVRLVPDHYRKGCRRFRPIALRDGPPASLTTTP